MDFFDEMMAEVTEDVAEFEGARDLSLLDTSEAWRLIEEKIRRDGFVGGEVVA